MRTLSSFSNIIIVSDIKKVDGKIYPVVLLSILAGEATQIGEAT
jgi:hypothetical protein